KYAFVRRYLLPRPLVRIEVLEEFPWASYSTKPDGPIEGVIAESGRMISLSEFPKVFQPPLHLCIQPSTKLNPAQIADWDKWVRLIGAQTDHTVTMVDLRNQNAVMAYCGDMELHLGAADSTIGRRIGRLASIHSVIDTLQDKLQY